MDVRPLRHRDFRLLFAAQSVSTFGTQITYAALPYHMYRSGSTLSVGLLGLAELVSLLATAFVGGALADAIDRRRLWIATDVALACGSAGLALLAATGWGAAIVAFGLCSTLIPALACLAPAGAADAISGIFRMTIWNETIPDALRGRLASIEMVSYSSGPLLGHVEAGVVAAMFGVTASVVSGGALCVAGVAACVALLPRFVGYDAKQYSEARQPIGAGES